MSFAGRGTLLLPLVKTVRVPDTNEEPTNAARLCARRRNLIYNDSRFYHLDIFETRPGKISSCFHLEFFQLEFIWHRYFPRTIFFQLELLLSRVFSTRVYFGVDIFPERYFLNSSFYYLEFFQLEFNSTSRSFQTDIFSTRVLF